MWVGPAARCSSGEALLRGWVLVVSYSPGEWVEAGRIELSSRRVGGVKAKGSPETRWAWLS